MKEQKEKISPRSIKSIKGKITLRPGYDCYIVEFKDGKARMISARSFKGKNKEIIERYELVQLCRLDPDITHLPKSNDLLPEEKKINRDKNTIFF